MILDSILRIAAADIKKNGQLPRSVIVYRNNKKFTYAMADVIAMAGRIAGIHSRRNDYQHAAFLVRRASWIVYQARKLSPAGGWTLNNKELAPLDGLKVLDLRQGYAGGLTGLALERVKAILNPSLTMYKTVTYHRALTEALKGVDVIIVNTDADSYMLQDYLARRCYLTMVLTSTQVEGFYEGVVLNGFEGEKVVAHG